jgi:hypothetical protein
VLAAGLVTATACIKRSEYNVHIAALFAFAEPLAITQALSWNVEQSGIAWVMLAAFVAVGADFSEVRRQDADALLVQSALFAALGICMTTGNENMLSLAFVIASAGVSIVAMQPHRRQLGCLAAALCVAAFWTRLVIADVHLIEAYTLPVAALTLFAGYRSNLRNAELSSWTAYGTGLSITTLPSLALLANSETLVRPALLAGAALVMLLAGASGRRKSPLVIGAATLGITAAIQFAPYVNHVPRWAAVGLVGALLIIVGATYERRLREARSLKVKFDAYR